MVTPEPRSHSTGRLDHSNPEKVEDVFKCNLMKMMETFKEKIKNSLKEMEKKRNKIWKKLMPSSNKPKKTQKTKTIRQVKETVQDLKTEIEIIKKKNTNRRNSEYKKSW